MCWSQIFKEQLIAVVGTIFRKEEKHNGISLLNSDYPIYLNVLTARVQPISVRLAEEQNEFRKNRSWILITAGIEKRR